MTERKPAGTSFESWVEQQIGAAAVQDPTGGRTTMHEGWKRLLDGNERWRAGGDAAWRAGSLDGQSPSAVVLSCSDSRVPVEMLFGQGVGDLFVVRTAGHTLDAAVLGSIEYAVGVLKTPLIVVLGHDGCGAVAAAIRMVDEGVVPPGHIRGVAERIVPSVRRARVEGAVTPGEIAGRHAFYTVEKLRSAMPLESTVAARYDLAEGTVTEVLQPVGEGATARRGAGPSFTRTG